MRKGKRVLKVDRKIPVALVALLALLCCTVGGTLAYLITSSGPVQNTFTPAQVQCEVDDDYVDHQKTNIKVTNPKDGEGKNVDAYIRVTIVPTWEEKGNPANAVAKQANLTLPTDLGTNWIKVGDYYYYTKILKVGETTATSLFPTAITVPTDDQYEMNVQVLAEAIQANPAGAVQEVWPVQVNSNGDLTAKNG